jgi:hypothetical protein
MEKEFVPYEQALELKELGFDEPCFRYYSNGELMYSSHTNNSMQRFRYAAPLCQQAFRWFREKYGFHSYIDCKWKNIGWEYELVDLNKMETIPTIGKYGYKTPNEAELACLKKLIEIVKQTK